MRRSYCYLAILTAVVGLAYAGYRYFQPRPADPRVLSADEVNEAETYSNILPADYVGPGTCAECHQSHYSKWKTHPHAVMNQMASQVSVKGDFNKAKITLPDGSAIFTTDGNGRYYMAVQKNGEPHRRYVVTRTVGSRYMQFYVGRQLEGPEPADDPIYKEHMLPFSYTFKMQRWLPRQFFDADGNEVCHEGIPQIEGVHKRPDVRPYNAVCMNCHNTYPYAYKIFKADFVGFREATVAAAIDPLSAVLSKTIPVEPTVESFESLPKRIDPEKHLVTLGISCESCHFGGREHALHEKEIRFLPTSKYVRITDKDPAHPHTPERKNPTTVLGICVQCHSGNGKLFPNGAGKSNSREGLDFQAGFCRTEMRCVDCHDPHRPSDGPSGGPVNPHHLDQCLKCHDQFADTKMAQAHSKHPIKAGVSCLDCHMPRYTQGLDDLIHTHRISHPVEEKMVAANSANACNLCHLDKSVRWTLTELEKGWGKKIEPKADWDSFAQLDVPAGDCWLKHKDNHMRLVATQSFARSPLGKSKLPELIHTLNDAEPLNRMFHACAVQKVCGHNAHDAIPVDITAAPSVREQQINAMLKQLGLVQ